jgi:hypothetical protein
MPDLGIPELMIIGVFGVLVGGVVAGIGWMILRPKPKQ